MNVMMVCLFNSPESKYDYSSRREGIRADRIYHHLFMPKRTWAPGSVALMVVYVHTNRQQADIYIDISIW